jgi:hypothetical protein
MTRIRTRHPSYDSPLNRFVREQRYPHCGRRGAGEQVLSRSRVELQLPSEIQRSRPWAHVQRLGHHQLPAVAHHLDDLVLGMSEVLTTICPRDRWHTNFCAIVTSLQQGHHRPLGSRAAPAAIWSVEGTLSSGTTATATADTRRSEGSAGGCWSSRHARREPDDVVSGVPPCTVACLADCRPDAAHGRHLTACSGTATRVASASG